MSKAPAFQFYPGDWLRNSNLRRCSHAARGAWVDVLCLMHDADQYGVLRWPLSDIAQAAGVPVDLLSELAAKGVLKGGDHGCDAFIFRPFHAGKHGDPITLIEQTTLPCWYSSRFVRDEHVRLNRGKSTQFTPDNQPNREPKRQPTGTPTRTIGERQGDGASSALASASAFAVTTANQDQEPSPTDSSPADASDPKRLARENIPYQQVADAYNAACGDLFPQVVRLTDKRRKAIRSRWMSDQNNSDQDKRTNDIEYWAVYFRYCRKLEFFQKAAKGQTTGQHAGWVPDFDFLMTEKCWIKVCEGTYQ